jgi:hypothetical protein
LLVDGQSLILATIAHIRIDRTRLSVMRTRILGHLLSLDRAPLRGCMGLPGLGCTLLGFRLSTFGFGCLFVG